MNTRLWKPTPEIDKIITKAWSDDSLAGKKMRVARLRIKAATGTEWPESPIRKRATELSLSAPRSTKPWRQEELAILHEHSSLPIKQICKVFKKHNLRRSVPAISRKLTTMGWTGEAKEGYTAASFSRYIGVCQKTVIKWIDAGYLHASRRGFAEASTYYITDKAVYRFLVSHVEQWSSAQLPARAWLVDVLTKGKLGAEDAGKKSDRAAA